MGIRALRSSDVEAVVAIHLERFPHSRSTQLGRAFLNRMYQWFVTHEPELALVSEVDGQIAGFIVGSKGGYGRRVFRFALLQILWGVLRKPSILASRGMFRLWHSYLCAFLPNAGNPTRNSANHDRSKIKIAVASIAVGPGRSGEGFYLMRALEDRARSIGAAQMSATVETINERLITLHLRLGWEIRTRKGQSVALVKKLNATGKTEPSEASAR